MATINGTGDRDSLTGTSLRDFIYGGNGADSLSGGAGGDRLYGGRGTDVLNGEDGSDRLFGQGGDDVLNGGAGADVLNGGVGADTMAGGANNDFYYVDRAGDVIIEDAGGGVDTVRSIIDWTLGENVERLTLTGARDSSGTGNDLANIIRGNRGANQLAGEDGDDRLLGGAGDDSLEGGRGRDILTGGIGADEFVFRDGDFAGMTATGSDRIVDFNHAQGDILDLQSVDADTLTEGNQDFQFIGSAGFNGVAGELRFEVAGGNTFVQGDTNGDGAADFSIRLDGIVTLQVDHFAL